MKHENAGHTLIELTIVLCLISVLAGMVIVRFPLNSSRQQTIAAARKLGNLIATYRDRAISEQTVYALQINAESGQYAIFKSDERLVPDSAGKPAIISGKLEDPISFGKISHPASPDTVPVTIYFDSRGVLQDLSIEIRHKSGAHIRLIPDQLTSVVRYEEN